MKNTEKINPAILAKLLLLEGAKFISINNYLSTTSGEIANHIVNTNISVENAKNIDLSKLQTCKDSDLLDIANSSKIALDIVRIAYSELLTSSIKNLSTDPEKRSNQSQGQSDAYVVISPALKFHIESQKFHIFAQAISKKVLVPGEYKTVNSSEKTIAKSAIKKHLDLRSEKFRNFIIDNVDNLTIAGENISTFATV
jgi:hypothetical protein